MRTLLVFALLVAANTHAGEVEVRDSKLSLQAFGAFVGSKATTSKVTSGLENPGNDLYFSRNTRFGLNASYRYSEQLEAFAQLMTRRSPGRESAQLDLLVLNYHFSDEWMLRVGRGILPIYLFSEQADVGVTYPWIEPPMETYPINPIKSIEGVRLSFRPEIGNHRFTFEGYAGNGGTRFNSNPGPHVSTYEPSLHEGVGGNLDVESKDQSERDFSYRFRVSALTGKVKIDAATEATIAAGTTGRYFTTYDLGRLHFYTAGSHIKFLKSELIAQYALRQAEGPVLPRAAAVHGTLLYHFGLWTPHYTYYRLLDIQGTLRPHPDAALGVTTLLNGVTYHTFGLNYQLDPSVVFKLQVMKYRETYENTGYNVDAYVTTVGADFVFF